MKKLLFICSMIVVSLTASAQFTIYRSIETPQSSYTPSLGYGDPFTIYEPVYGSTYQRPAKPKIQEVTLKGYYKKSDGWYYAPIRVGIIGEEIRLLSIKMQNRWNNCGTKANEVGVYDAEEIHDNFNYKVFTSLCGMVYF